MEFLALCTYILHIFLRIFWPILIILRMIWDKAVTLALSIALGKKRKAKLPPVFNPLLLLPATVLAENIRKRKLTSVEIVRAFVTRCSDVNPLLNAIVQENFQDALLQAKAVDDQIDEGYDNKTLTPEKLRDEKPFLGVPFTVKETISVTGFPNTAGLLIRSHETAYEDAVIVERMRDAGAILLATTNVPELGMWWECANPLYGRTNNPYDARRTSGGSSGGEAALMCACGSPISIGTDTGGSIRTPAFFCGLFGHKPTSGIVPLTGCNIHNDGREDISIQVAGPITRHSVDIIPVLSILAGENAAVLELHKKAHIGVLRFYMMEDDGNRVTTSSVVPALKQIQKDVVKHFLDKYDIDVQKVKIPDLRSSYLIWQQKMDEDYSDNSPITEQLLDNQGEVNIWTELFRFILGRARFSFASLLQVALANFIQEFHFLRDQKRLLQGRAPGPKGHESYGSKWRLLKMEMQIYAGKAHLIKFYTIAISYLKFRMQKTDPSKIHKYSSDIVSPPYTERFLGDDGILLYPSHPTLATFHRESYFKPFNFAYTAIFNALGFPVTQVPLGLEPESGLPLGIQVVGGMHMDRLTIGVAKDLEKAFGGWRCPGKII